MSSPTPDVHFDPRPRAVASADGVRVTGWLCTACLHPSMQRISRCTQCGSSMRETDFATEGQVWASTCLRVRVPGHEPPFAVAYILLDGGPRVLAHTPGGSPLRPGSRARITGVTNDGDLVAEEETEPHTGSTQEHA